MSIGTGPLPGRARSELNYLPQPPTTGKRPIGFLARLGKLPHAYQTIPVPNLEPTPQPTDERIIETALELQRATLMIDREIRLKEHLRVRTYEKTPPTVETLKKANIAPVLFVVREGETEIQYLCTKTSLNGEETCLTLISRGVLSGYKLRPQQNTNAPIMTLTDTQGNATTMQQSIDQPNIFTQTFEGNIVFEARIFPNLEALRKDIDLEHNLSFIPETI